jgi:hypothetical protein
MATISKQSASVTIQDACRPLQDGNTFTVFMGPLIISRKSAQFSIFETCLYWTRWPALLCASRSVHSSLARPLVRIPMMHTRTWKVCLTSKVDINEIHHLGHAESFHELDDSAGEYCNSKSLASPVQRFGSGSYRGKRPKLSHRQASQSSICCSVCGIGLDVSTSCWFCVTCFDKGG